MSLSPEAYARLKEAEKAHLATLKRLKRLHALLQRQKQIDRSMSAILNPKVLDELEESLRQLNEETARMEAALDLALESLEATEPPEESTHGEPSPLPEKTIGRPIPPKPETDDERKEN